MTMSLDGSGLLTHVPPVQAEDVFASWPPCVVSYALTQLN